MSTIRPVSSEANVETVPRLVGQGALMSSEMACPGALVHQGERKSPGSIIGVDEVNDACSSWKTMGPRTSVPSERVARADFSGDGADCGIGQEAMELGGSAVHPPAHFRTSERHRGGGRPSVSRLSWRSRSAR
jgi:hypothetical protein